MSFIDAQISDRESKKKTGPMKKYRVLIDPKYSSVYEVKANNVNEAKKKAIKRHERKKFNRSHHNVWVDEI